MIINIYGISYEIKEVSQEEFTNNLGEQDKLDDNVNLGRHLGVTQLILLAKELKYDNKRATLIHELSHAIKWVLGYGKMNEESWVQFIAIHHDFIHSVVSKYFNQSQHTN